MLVAHLDQVVACRLGPRRARARLWMIVVVVGMLAKILSNVEAADKSGPIRGTASDPVGDSVGTDYRIESVRAYLWHEKLNKLSTDDVLKFPTGTLWNIPFGAGDMPPSRSTLVVIEITGPRDAAAPRKHLELFATARLRNGQKRLLLHRSISIVSVNAQGSTFMPFLLHDTGCVPIELHAEIRGQRHKVSADRVLDFRCGE